MQLSPYVPIVINEDWVIGQSAKDTSKYIVVIASDTTKEVERIAVEWLTEEEVKDANSIHENDYCGEIISITADLISDPKSKEGMLAGKKCFGYFKIIKEEE